MLKKESVTSKAVFLQNILMFQNSKTHSANFALSDKPDEMLAEKSTTIKGDCDESIEIFSCLEDVEEFVKEKGDNMIYDMCCYKRYQNIHKTSSL